MGLTSRIRAWTSHDPLSHGSPDADPRLRDARGRPDPNRAFLGEQSQTQPGNTAGLELALYRFVRWLIRRRPSRGG